MRPPSSPPPMIAPLAWLLASALMAGGSAAKEQDTFLAETGEHRVLSDSSAALIDSPPTASEPPPLAERLEFPDMPISAMPIEPLTIPDADNSVVGLPLSDELEAYCDSFLFEAATESSGPAVGIANHGGSFDRGDVVARGSGTGGMIRQRAKSLPGRLYDTLVAALCECDECYQPQWRLLESASLWVDSARPQNRTRLRWDYGPGMILPDRAEYFWARVGRRGPNPPAGSLTIAELDYHELSQYTETAHGGFSAFVVTPYRSLYMEDAGHAAGFGDIQIGTKSLLHDTPLLQITMQMTTTIPSANAKKGLGTGHVSLEPALLIGLALTDRDFLQAQAAEWIPIGGDTDYEGALLRWGIAWNRRLWQRDRDNVLTANLDLVGWSFQDGAYTDPVRGQQSANNETYLYMGPGTRLLMCGKFEFGLGGIFALTQRHFARSVLRSEITMRY